jgi:hypothetical protein
MEFSGIAILAVVWFLVSLVSQASKRTQTPRQGPKPQPPRRPPVHGGGDPSQQEGTRLELVLRQVQRALEEAGAEEGVARKPPPRYEELDEARSLEVDPEVTSLENVVNRPARRRIDQDDQAEQVAAGRIKAASARDTARSAVDHAQFDERIRQQPADHTAARGYTSKQLRDAIVWREILDPPVSLRRETGPGSWPSPE